MKVGAGVTSNEPRFTADRLGVDTATAFIALHGYVRDNGLKLSKVACMAHRSPRFPDDLAASTP
jgi:hypothetical protein